MAKISGNPVRRKKMPKNAERIFIIGLLSFLLIPFSHVQAQYNPQQAERRELQQQQLLDQQMQQNIQQQKAQLQAQQQAQQQQTLEAQNAFKNQFKMTPS